MAKKLLIAAVMVTCYVDGVRTDIEPGNPVPELGPHDEAELKRMGALIDPDDTARDAKADAAAERKGAKDFQAARAAVIAAEESTLAPDAKA